MSTRMFCYSVVFIKVIHVILLAIVSSTTFVVTGPSIAERKTDEDALKAFRLNIIQDPQGALSSWNDSVHYCQWEGITCGRRHRRVTVLDLNSRGLSGSLSPYVGNLSFLMDLVLHNNHIQGEIPRELGRLFRLTSLFLNNNSFKGEIPSNLSYCSRLLALNLAQNNLVGEIPLEFGSVYNLEALALHQNNLTGGIPAFLGNFTSLEIMSLADNAFAGNIPDSVGQLKKLSSLGLAGNNLSGTIPPSLYNLSFLTNFSLSENHLHGSLPPNLGLTLPNLEIFQISDNFFTGSIPASLSNATKLELIQMGKNSFSGKLIVDFRDMRHLQYLILVLNKLGSGEVDEMSFISSLANCSNLRMLNLAGNQFKATLPQSIGNLSVTLERFYINVNRFYGSIPTELANLLSLEMISMSDNQFTGLIPKEIGKLQYLQSISLFNNQLSGDIPSSLGNLSLLSQLSFSNNKLSGAIPISLGNLKQLSFLDLSQNNLNGTIPKQIFDITDLSIGLYLAQNRLVGSIPQGIGNLRVVTDIDMSDNNLSGEIPSELSLCSSLEYLHLEGNSLVGSIPPSMSSLKGIREIDLSRNNLSGYIPKFLEMFRLEKLNLSSNHLEGELPTKGVFANASAISIVGNSNKLCGGIAELKLSKCPNNHSKNKRISRLVKIIITITGAICGSTMMSSFILCWLKKKRQNQASSFVFKGALLKVSYEGLLKATDGFSPSQLIGVGSFGTVFRGILDPDGTVVAIKVLNLQHQEASKSFMAECKALKNIRHKNLVRVITSCSSIDFQGNDFKAIVYEFMENGNLEKWLHPAPEIEKEWHNNQSLTLLKRINIAIDVACALDYLHHQCHEPIVHCDLKPNNVLLDGDMIAHVGDFGLVRFLPELTNPNQSSSIGVKGTIGYIAPEYGQGSKISTNGDVYGYGILLLEMMTRKRPTDSMFERDLNLHSFARMALPNRVMDIVDPVLIDEEVAVADHRMREAINKSRTECMVSMVRIGVACSTESPQDRMNISHVVHELQLVRGILLQQPTRSDLNQQQGQEVIASSGRI